jgi:hypothetical protein
MSQFAAQWSGFELPCLVHANEMARAADALRTILRVGTRVGVRVAAAAGFAGAMWLLLAGPGFLDGRSSTVDHISSQRTPARHAVR